MSQSHVSVNTFCIRIKMSVLYILYAVYAQWAHQDGQLPLYQLAFDPGKSCLEDCPVKVEELLKVVTAAIKYLNVQPSLAIFGGGAQRSPIRGMPGGVAVTSKRNGLVPEDNIPNRQPLLVTPSNCLASVYKMQRILDDVQYVCNICLS